MSRALTFNGSGTQTLDNGNQNFYNVVHSGSGTLRLTGSELTVTNDLANTAGVLDLNGQDLTLTKAGANFSNPGIVQLRGSETIQGLTQDMTQGMWRYVGDGDGNADTYTVKDFGVTDYYNLTIASVDANDTYQLGGSLSVAGGLTVSGGSFNANGQITSVSGLTTVGGGEYRASGAAQSLNGGLMVSGGTFTGSSGAVSAANVNMTAGTLTAPQGAFNVSGNWNIAGGSFAAGTNTVTFNGSGTQALDNGNQNFYNVVHSGSGTLQLTGSGLAVTNDLTNLAGTLDANTEDISVGGDWINAGVFTAGTNTVTFNGSGTQTLDNGNQNFYNVVHSGSGTLQLTGSELAVTNDLTNAAGVLDLNGQDLTLTKAGANFSNPGIVQLRGSETIQGLTQDVTQGTWRYVGDGDGNPDTYTVKDFGVADYYNLTIASIDANDTYQLGGSLSVAGGLTVSGGVFDANGQINLVNGLTTVNGGEYQASGAAQNLNGGLTVGGGTFTGGSGVVSSTNVNMSAGTLIAPQGAFNVSGNWNIAGGSFAAGTNTVTFNGSGTQALDSGSQDFYNIVHSGSGTLQLTGSELTVTNDLTNAAGVLDLNGQDLTLTKSGANFSNPGTVQLRGSETVQGLTQDITQGTWRYVGDGDGNPDTYIVKDFGVTDYYNLVIASIDANDVYQLNGVVGVVNLNIVAGTLVAPQGVFNVSGNWSAPGGSFAAGTNTVTFNGNGTQTLDSGGQDFYNIEHSGNGTLRLTGSELTVTNDLTNLAGTFDTDTEDVLVGGDWINDGVFTAGTNAVIFNGSGTQTLDSGSQNFYNIVHSGSGILRLTGSALIINNDLKNLSGVFDLNGQDLTMLKTVSNFINPGIFQLQGAENINGLVQDTAQGIWRYVGDGDGNPDIYYIKDSSGTDYYNLEIASIDANDTYQLMADLDVYGVVAMLKGVFDANGHVSSFYPGEFIRIRAWILHYFQEMTGRWQIATFDSWNEFFFPKGGVFIKVRGRAEGPRYFLKKIYERNDRGDMLYFERVAASLTLDSMAGVVEAIKFTTVR